MISRSFFWMPKDNLCRLWDIRWVTLAAQRITRKGEPIRSALPATRTGQSRWSSFHHMGRRVPAKAGELIRLFFRPRGMAEVGLS